MDGHFRRILLSLGLALFTTTALAQMPPITGKPMIDTPPLLEWPYDSGTVKPNLNDPTSNTLFDMHANLSTCDVVLSSEGNYHPALRDIWPVYLAKFKDDPLQNWFYSTSPPVFMPQIQNHVLQFGNLYATCMPSVAVASKKVIDKVVAAGQNDGPPQALYQDRGDVILVKKGNPKHIRSVWDLGRPDVKLVTPNPEQEPGAFSSYVGNIYNIAANDPQPPTGKSAEKLINTIFNKAAPGKWLAGKRIHHRDEPWSVAYGKADAAVILYHLGRYTQETFPDQFDIVPLGGTVDNPQPLKGTKIGVRYIVALKGPWTPKQLKARDTLIQTLMSDTFTKILEKRGLARPAGFQPR